MHSQSTAPRRLPPPVKRLLSLLPAQPGSRLCVTLLNTAVARHLPQDVRDALKRRWRRLSVDDAGLSFDFAWDGKGFVPCPRGARPELVIRATLHDFGLLAARKEDPDTLFFSRRLAMEGDTELGLLIKNTLDAIDGPLFDPAWLAPRELFRQLHARRPGAGRRAS
jgi:predicted lipid carrier protein YhbT